MLNEVCQAEKYHMVSLICEIKHKTKQYKTELIETENRLVVAGRSGAGQKE